MSAPRSSWASRSNPTPRPADAPGQLARAVPTVRLATTTSRTPWCTSARAVASAMRPGADEEHAPPGQVVEDLLGQLDRHRGHRRRPGADARLRAHLLAHLERLAEEPVEDRPGRPLLGGELPGLAHLALDLALAHDHRVEAGGHPEELGGRAVVAQDVAGAGELVGRDVGAAPRARRPGRPRRAAGRARRRRSRCGCRWRARRPRRPPPRPSGRAAARGPPPPTGPPSRAGRPAPSCGRARGRGASRPLRLQRGLRPRLGSLGLHEARQELGLARDAGRPQSEDEHVHQEGEQHDRVGRDRRIGRRSTSRYPVRGGMDDPRVRHPSAPAPRRRGGVTSALPGERVRPELHVADLAAAGPRCGGRGRVPLSNHRPRPFQPAFGSSMRPSSPRV